jgi:hypothetical protein
METLGVARGALRVMEKDLDPYTVNTEANRRNAKWFAEQLDRFVPKGTVHLRGLHYLLSTTAIVRPIGSVYINNLDCWNWLKSISKVARWLGVIEFERIHDARNEAPIWSASDLAVEPNEPIERSFRIYANGFDDIVIPDRDDLVPQLSVDPDRTPTQAYRLGIIGEKSSLRPVIEPLAAQYSIDAVLDTGDFSDTHLYQMAKRAYEDGRPFIVFFLSDFDPQGWNMPTVAGRKYQALFDLAFPGLDVRVYPVALTLEQCIAYKLPSAPLRDTERRAEDWVSAFNREQTELDALMALHPGALEDILHKAIRPFFDPTLERRYRRALQIPRKVQKWFNELPEVQAATEEIGELHAIAGRALDDLTSAIEHYAEAVAEAVENADGAPKLTPVRPNLRLRRHLGDLAEGPFGGAGPDPGVADHRFGSC